MKIREVELKPANPKNAEPTARMSSATGTKIRYPYRSTNHPATKVIRMNEK